MQNNFTGHRMDITPALRTFTQEKFDKLERHFEQISVINVVFDAEKLLKIVEATIVVTKDQLHARSESDDMYTAITQAAEKLERQALKFKDKKTNQKRQVKSKLVAEKIEAAETEPTPTVVEASKEVNIIPSQRYADKPMSSEEAAVELKQSEDHFLVFRDGKTEKIAVIYKRKNGDFGLIEP